MDVQSYFVIQKLIKDMWDDWVVFNPDIELDEVMNIYDSKKDKTNFRVIKRSDKVLHFNQS